MTEDRGPNERRPANAGQPGSPTPLRGRIAAARKARKISQAELGKRVGLTAGDISRIELGYQDLRPEEARAIAAVLGLDSPPIGRGLAVSGARFEPAAPGPSSGSRLPAQAAQPSHPAALPAPSAGHALAPPQGEYSHPPDLGDPAHFSELPDFRLLEVRPGWDIGRLRRSIGYANAILHTSRVPAAIWREWRAFEKAASLLLKKESGT